MVPANGNLYLNGSALQVRDTELPTATPAATDIIGFWDLTASGQRKTTFQDLIDLFATQISGSNNYTTDVTLSGTTLSTSRSGMSTITTDLSSLVDSYWNADANGITISDQVGIGTASVASNKLTVSGIAAFNTITYSSVISGRGTSLGFAEGQVLGDFFTFDGVSLSGGVPNGSMFIDSNGLYIKDLSGTTHTITTF